MSDARLLRARLLTAAWWIVPPLLCLILYWPGLLAWFQQDDFVWLNLPRQAAHGWHDFLVALFRPTIQGTWRPLSERAFFLLFGALFDADALPYRIWVFLTMFANLALAASITARLTGSRAAGFWTAMLWAANSKLAVVVSWTCEYILVASGFFLLLAFHFFLKHVETGDRRFYRWTWAVFLTGFLAMETNLVFPLLAGSYALLCAPKYFRKTIPFFIASGVYAGLHLVLAPNLRAGPYVIHIDRAIPFTFLTYWRMTFEPAKLQYLTPFPAIMAVIEMTACTVALLGFALSRVLRREWLPVVFVAWFGALLVPVLPLRDHIAEYHLTLASMAMAALAAYGLVCAWRAGIAFKAMSAVLLIAFLMMSVPVAWQAADWWRERSEEQQALVAGVVRAHQLHPGKVILLDGVSFDLFWGAIMHRPFLYLGIQDVYLTPGSEERIGRFDVQGKVSDYSLPADETRRGLDHDEIVVYSAAQFPLKNITHSYQVPAGLSSAAAMSRLDVADPLAAGRLGRGWFDRESGFRWMSRAATVTLSGPRSTAQKLYVTAVCVPAQLTHGPLQMTLTVDGARLAPVEFAHAGPSTFAFALPPSSVGKADIEVRIEVNRTIHIGSDVRELGLAFGQFEIK